MMKINLQFFGGRGSAAGGSGSSSASGRKLNMTELNNASIGTIIEADGRQMVKHSDSWHELDTNNKFSNYVLAQSKDFTNVKKVGEVDLSKQYYDRQTKEWVNDKSGSTKNVSLNAKQQKAVDQAKNNLTFNKGYAEITANHYSNAGMSNQKMVDALNAKNDGFKYEYKVETTPGNVFNGGTSVKHHRIYRKKI